MVIRPSASKNVFVVKISSFLQTLKMKWNTFYWNICISQSYCKFANNGYNGMNTSIQVWNQILIKEGLYLCIGGSNPFTSIYKYISVEPLSHVIINIQFHITFYQSN